MRERITARSRSAHVGVTDGRYRGCVPVDPNVTPGRTPATPHPGGSMRSTLPTIVALVLGGVMSGCTNDEATPLGPAVPAESAPAHASWGPETPNFNLEIVLRGEGFGLVKFRQPNDDQKIVYLDTWVRGLAPNTEYQLQRADDLTVDDDCTSKAWLTLGRGVQAQRVRPDSGG